MHDLMHDLAQEVAEDEIIVGNSLPKTLSKKVRQLFLDGEEWTESSFPKGNIRTCYMYTKIDSQLVKPLIENWSFLRSLRLYVPDAEYLPKSICQLLHLRYLDLSDNIKLEKLPNSIAKLYNLQSNCGGLPCMPLGINQLTNLQYLTHFKVGKVSSIGNQFGGQLNDLKLLVNLRGELRIKIHENLVNKLENKWESGYLEHIMNLKVIRIFFSYEPKYEALIKKLKPNRNLMHFELELYYGTEIPRWGRAQDDWSITFPNLVNIELGHCQRLRGIPLLSNLKHLKTLSLWLLNNLEYMETNAIGGRGFFPSLEFLNLVDLKRLKGWWGGVGESDMPHWQPLFPRLWTVVIQSCPKLTSLPPCPSLESLEVERINKAFRILPAPQGSANLHVRVDSVGYLTTVHTTHLITKIEIQNDYKLKRLSEIEKVFKSCSSLRSLEIEKCARLTSISGALEHLTALESLVLMDIPTLEDNADDMPWRSLCHNLRFLCLVSLRSLQMLPRGMKHLTALQDLQISDYKSLKGLLEWISCLASLQSLLIVSFPGLKSVGTIQNITSLQKLKILDCPDLREACQEPSGKEWPNIRHIPHISISQ
ncbi:putative disease resistance protein RGA1 [Silene latifolia]|uniref:putative disease resistance protein RGA1 n=1 Tax=Silene latifolia TaxID=37657 RepID=UPI003D787B0B